MTPRLCGYPTRAAYGCRLTARWRIRLGRYRCWQHAVIEARKLGVREISNRVDGRTVEVRTVPLRPHRFVMPRTRAQVLRCLPTIRNLTDLSKVIVFVLDAQPPMVKLGSRNDPVCAAVLEAKGRLKAAASDEELARHIGAPVVMA